jgi:hypothetical protein
MNKSNQHPKGPSTNACDNAGGYRHGHHSLDPARQPIRFRNPRFGSHAMGRSRLCPVSDSIPRTWRMSTSQVQLLSGWPQARGKALPWSRRAALYAGYKPVLRRGKLLHTSVRRPLPLLYRLTLDKEHPLQFAFTERLAEDAEGEKRNEHEQQDDEACERFLKPAAKEIAEGGND